jgi:hypothetical protein
MGNRKTRGWPRAGLAILMALGGCAGSKSKLATCQQDKEQLLATIREQRESNRALQEQVASLETRLDQAEKTLALGSGGTRLSSRPPSPAGPKPEPLPWRLPAEKDGAAGTSDRATRSR